MKKHKWLGTSCMILLVACGGGGGGSSPTPPAPAPAPTPSPPPPPPPATTFTAAALGPIVGIANFDVDGNGDFLDNGDLAASTNRMGEFGRDVLGKLGLGGFADEAPGDPIYPILGSGIDAASGLLFGLLAPAGATTLSPLTTIAYHTGSIDEVRLELSLDSGANRLRSSPNLLAFNAARNIASTDPDRQFDAARLTVINLHLLNLAALASAQQFIDNGLGLNGFAENFASYIRTDNSAGFDDTGYILGYFQHIGLSCGANGSALEALADLVAKYGSIVPDTIDTLDLAAKYNLLFRFFIAPEYERLCVGGSAADIAEVRGITAQDIDDQLAVFSSAMPPDISGTLFAEPDYREIDGASLTLLVRCDLPQGSQQRYPYCNDFAHEGGLVTERYIIVGVRSGNTSQLEATQATNGEITLSTRNGFRGLTFFDYQLRLDDGQQVESRVYVRIR